MAELDRGAARLLEKHLGRVRRTLKRGGTPSEEIDMALAGTEEQVHAILDAGQPASPIRKDRMREVLAEMETPEGWASETGFVRGKGMAVLALGVTLLTLIILMAAGVFSDMIGGDGGAIMATIGVFGFVPAIVLGLFARQHLAGRAALVLSGLFVGMFVLIMALDAVSMI
ncbi:MAG: hypothetical protein AAFQ79_07605 [Pseudomonadota bacterium]